MERIHLETIQRGVLQDIDDVRPLNDMDYEVLKELGDVLRRHKYTERFGVCLLHKHFDLAVDEELIEETDCDARVSVTRVQKLAAQDGNSIETMWRYTDGIQSITTCKKRCFYNYGHKKEHSKEAQ